MTKKYLRKKLLEIIHKHFQEEYGLDYAVGDFMDFISQIKDKTQQEAFADATKIWAGKNFRKGIELSKLIREAKAEERKEFKKQIKEANEEGYERGHSDGFDVSIQRFKEELAEQRKQITHRLKVGMKDERLTDERMKGYLIALEKL